MENTLDKKILISKLLFVLQSPVQRFATAIEIIKIKKENLHMANYEKMHISEVQQKAKQDDSEALFEMAWRVEALPSELPNTPEYRCAWQDYWFEKASDKGHVDARRRYAFSLIERIFDVDARKKAMKYFRSLAKDYDDGVITKKGYGMISKLWLGIMLCQGLGLGNERDSEKGVALIEEADSLANGFEGKILYEDFYQLAVTYGQGCTQRNGEPLVDDLRQAVAYLQKAINCFDQKSDDPNNRGVLSNTKQYLEMLKKRKEHKEQFKDSSHALGIDVTISNPEFIKWQEGMMAISPASQQRKDADKSALARLRQCLAQKGW